MKIIITELLWDELNVSLLLFSVYKEAHGMHICFILFLIVVGGGGGSGGVSGSTFSGKVMTQVTATLTGIISHVSLTQC